MHAGEDSNSLSSCSELLNSVPEARVVASTKSGSHLCLFSPLFSSDSGILLGVVQGLSVIQICRPQCSCVLICNVSHMACLLQPGLQSLFEGTCEVMSVESERLVINTLVEGM